MTALGCRSKRSQTASEKRIIYRGTLEIAARNLPGRVQSRGSRGSRKFASCRKHVDSFILSRQFAARISLPEAPGHRGDEGHIRVWHYRIEKLNTRFSDETTDALTLSMSGHFRSLIAR